MREIKFRCWDKGRNCWLNEMDTYQQVVNQARWNPEAGEYYVLMQYTGLHDKNGKLIYEGDIVKYKIPVHYDEQEKKEVIKKVRYTGGAFFPVLFMEYEFHDFDDKPLTITDVEIIGNIYENPELLER